MYGQTKLAGEQAIAATGCPHIILRTTWVYDIRGKNFLRTVLRLAREREELTMVATSTALPPGRAAIAEATAQIVARCAQKRDLSGWGYERHLSPYCQPAKPLGLDSLNKYSRNMKRWLNGPPTPENGARR